jgi:hypothetical protein
MLDFDQYYPVNKEAEPYKRIIASPPYAKLIINTIDESILKIL